MQVLKRDNKVIELVAEKKDEANLLHDIWINGVGRQSMSPWNGKYAAIVLAPISLPKNFQQDERVISHAPYGPHRGKECRVIGSADVITGEPWYEVETPEGEKVLAPERWLVRKNESV